jgi:hypothetical protein
VVGSRLLFGWYIARKRRQGDPEAYFLGGRNIHWVFIGLSFYVSNMSSSTFVGLPSSLVSKKPSNHQIAALTWSRNFWRSESEQLKPLPWYRDYRIQSVGLMAAAMLIVIARW